MEPLAPDWRAIGSGATTGPGEGATTEDHGPAHRPVPVTPRLIGWLIGGLLAAALTGGAVFLALVPGTGGVLIESAPDDSTSRTIPDTRGPDGDAGRLAPSTLDLVVDIEGAVAHPGLVHVPAGSRVGDALTRAGGFAPNADLTRTASDLNLAQSVTDGLKLVVPAIGLAATAADGTGTVGQRAATTGSTVLIDLNHATEAELDTLPGVGPATIAKIVAARQSAPFTSPEDLRTRAVVGDAAFEKLQGLVTAGR